MDWSTRTVTIGYFVVGAVSLALVAVVARSLSRPDGKLALRRVGAMFGAVFLAALTWLVQQLIPGGPSTLALWLAHLTFFALGLLIVWWLTLREGLHFGRWQDYAWGGAIGEILFVGYAVFDSLFSRLPVTAGQLGFSIGAGAVRGLVLGGLLGLTIRALVFAVRGRGTKARGRRPIPSEEGPCRADWPR